MGFRRHQQPGQPRRGTGPQARGTRRGHTLDRRTQRERVEDERAHGREEDDERGRGDKATQHLAVGEGAAERRVGGAEHVEEAPRRQQRQQRSQRERVRQEGRGQAQRGDRGLVDAEVGEVLPEVGSGLGQGVWAGER